MMNAQDQQAIIRRVRDDRRSFGTANSTSQIPNQAAVTLGHEYVVAFILNRGRRNGQPKIKHPQCLMGA